MSETVKDFENEEFSFEEELEKSFKTVSNGQKVVGTVVGIAPKEMQIDIGTKHAGYVPLHELTDDPNARAEDLVKKGDELNLVVVRVNDVEGTVQLSKRRYDELVEKGVSCDLEEIARDIAERDERDSTREIAPLKQAEDAVLVDSSHMTIEEVVAAIVKLCD